MSTDATLGVLILDEADDYPAPTNKPGDNLSIVRGRVLRNSNNEFHELTIARWFRIVLTVDEFCKHLTVCDVKRSAALSLRLCDQFLTVRPPQGQR